MLEEPLEDRFVDWPIKYSHLEKWYGDAEKDIGVSADVADQRYLGISFSPGYRLSPRGEAYLSRRPSA